MGWSLFLLTVVVFYASAAWAIFLLWRMKQFTLKKGALFVTPDGRLSLRYPPWWECRVDGNAFHFLSHEKDGVLSLSIRDRIPAEQRPQDILQAHTDGLHIAWDTPEIEEMEVNGIRGAHIESRATVGDDQRRYFQIWVFANASCVAIFEYSSSVMFGMVDAFYLHQMIQTLQMPPLLESCQDVSKPRGPAGQENFNC